MHVTDLDPWAACLMTVIAIALALLFLIAGVGHFAALRYALSLVPAWIPSPRAVLAASGAVNVAVGVLLLLPATRSAGGWIAAALITVYLVSHIDAARRPEPAGPLMQRPIILAVRIGVNVFYLAAALLVETQT